MDGPDPQRVAVHVGMPYADARLTDCINAARAWVEKRRCNTAPADLWLDDDVQQGAAIYAGLLYVQRTAPQGFPGLDDLGRYSEDTGQAMANVYRLVGADPVVA